MPTDIQTTASAPVTSPMPAPKLGRWASPNELPVIDFVHLDNNGPVADSIVQTRLDDVHVGQPLDIDAVERAMNKVYGLEYHNKAEGIDVKLDPTQPLHIPNVKGGGFRFSSWKAFDVFGKEGGWLKAATISFGQSLEPQALERAQEAAARADLVVALGSTLSVYPAASFPLLAAQRGAPYVIINRGAIEQDGTADDVLQHPATEFVKDFFRFIG